MKFKDFLKKVEGKEENLEIILGDIYTCDRYGYIIPIAKNVDLFICLSLNDEYRFTTHDAHIVREDYKIGELFLYVDKEDIKEI